MTDIRHDQLPNPRHVTPEDEAKALAAIMRNAHDAEDAQRLRSMLGLDDA